MHRMGTISWWMLAAGLLVPPTWAQTHLWSHSFGDASTYQWAEGVGADSSGNVVLTGGFSSSADFGGGTRTSLGNHDFYVVKYDRNGVYQWDRQFGDAGDQYEPFSAVDAAGNIVVAGHFTGSVDFGGGPLTSSGIFDICLAKLDPDGNHIWSRRFGDANDQRTRGVAVDAAGNVVVVGYFFGSVDFGGGVLTSWGNEDIFVAEFDAAGNHLWSQRFGDSNSQSPEDVDFDAAGNVLVIGRFRGTADFGGGPLTSWGDWDIFLVKLAANGAHLWSQRFGDASAQSGYGVAADMVNDVFITGEFYGGVQFGLGWLTSAGGNDIFLAKFGADGGPLWNKRFGDAESTQMGKSVAADGSGNVVATGFFRGTVNLGGSPFTSTGYEDTYLAKFDAGGNHLWSRSYGDAVGQMRGTVLALDALDDILLAGYFWSTVNFGGGTLTSHDTAWDPFVVKLTIVDSIDITTASPDSIGPGVTGSLDLVVRDAHGARRSGRAVDLRFTSTLGLVCDSGPFVENPDTTYTVGYTTCPLTGLDTEVVSYVNATPAIADNLQLLVTRYPDEVAVHVDPPRRVRPQHSIPVRVSILNGSGARVPDERTPLALTSLTGLGSVTPLVLQSDSSYTAQYQAGSTAGFERLMAFDADAATVQRDSVTIDVTNRAIVLSVLDIGNDQGRQVRITWEQDLRDALGSPTPIAEYVVWRRVDPVSKIVGRVVSVAEIGSILDHLPGGEAERLLLALGSTLWEPVGPRVPAMMWQEYASVVPTLADSTIASGMHFSVFFVSAHTQNPQVFYGSDPDSGYSVDNLAPAAPMSLVHADPGLLSWDEAEEADFDYFTVYGSWTGTFDETAVLLGRTTSAGLDVRESPYAHYFVTATDFAGNTGPAADLDEPVAVGPGELPATYALTACRPNPFRSSTRIEFALPRRGALRIQIYDVAGRRLKTLVEDTLPAGRHGVEWHGEDAMGARVPAGIYLCRLEAADHRLTRKLVVIR